MPDAEHDLMRAMVVLTIKDYKKKRITARKCEDFCKLCGYFISARKLSDKILNLTNDTRFLK